MSSMYVSCMFPCMFPRTCWLTYSGTRGGTHGRSQTLGDRVACFVSLIYLWRTYCVPRTTSWSFTSNGGGDVAYQLGTAVQSRSVF